MDERETLESGSVAEVEIFYDNLFCFGCRSKMLELVPYQAYQCECGLRCTDETIETKLLQGDCPQCLGEKCPACDWMSLLASLVQVPDPEEE